MSEIQDIFGGLISYPIENIVEFSKNIETLEGKKIEKWSNTLFLRYFLKLRSRRFPKTTLLDKEDQKSIGMMKHLHNKCKSPQELKNYLDNIVINWDAVKEKHFPRFKTDEYPTLAGILYFADTILEDIRTTNWTYSRTHRVSPLDNGQEASPW